MSSLPNISRHENDLLRIIFPFISTVIIRIKAWVGYIFSSLFLKSKREHLWNQ